MNIQNFKEWDTFIAREGHQISVTSNDIFVDGKKTNKYTIERNYCFGMGDNRENSSDSRYWGLIPWENVVGTPILVYWSWDTNIPLSNIFDKIGSSRLGRIGKLIH